ncbi:MAG: ATPase, T2SS/T4P/T4SS family [Candidatus Omnitrophota bacterium]
MIKKYDKILYDALMEKGDIEKGTLNSLIKEAESTGKGLGELLIRNGLLPEKEVLNIFSEKTGLISVDVRMLSINKSVLDRVPVKIATYYRFLPIDIKDRTLTVAVSMPLDIKTQDEIRAQLGYDIDIILSSHKDIMEGLKKYYGFATDTLEKISSHADTKESAGEDASQEKVEDIEKLAEDASVIKLVNQIILEAYRKRATDIHIEPYRNQLSLRYRVDGLLYDANVPPEIKNFLRAIISRIKIMSNLNIVERRLPQDGRAVVKVQDEVLDLRISTMPTPYGESVVIRILPAQMLFSLERLGLSKPDLQIFENIIQKPHGIIFVTGPTGSGKTTTLYACLSRINTKERKIITLEDPIEYEMTGITQIQVMPEIGLDFARGLRSILRHDPDVIMVGEVRDLETADIAIRVALTGHLVLSTLHTNDAVSAITRLVDIGVESYLIASSVEAFIAQRLIRLICPDCKYEDTKAPAEIRELIAKDLGLKSKDVRIFRGKGCINCNHTGFFGRTAIYEILLLDEDMKELILKKASSNQLNRVAVSKGMKTIRQDGWQKVISGLSTPEEVMNITSGEGRLEAEGNEAVSGAKPAAAAAKTSGEDRRAYVRLDKNINLRYKTFSSKQELFKRGFTAEQLSVTKNISGGGLLFISEETLAVGSIIELTVELPDGEKAIECLARVIRIEEIEEEKNYNVAVCFLDITGADRARMNKYVASEME